MSASRSYHTKNLRDGHQPFACIWALILSIDGLHFARRNKKQTAFAHSKWVWAVVKVVDQFNERASFDFALEIKENGNYAPGTAGIHVQYIAMKNNKVELNQLIWVLALLSCFPQQKRNITVDLIGRCTQPFNRCLWQLVRNKHNKRPRKIEGSIWLRLLPCNLRRPNDVPQFIDTTDALIAC